MRRDMRVSLCYQLREKEVSLLTVGVLTCCQFSTTASESFSIVNHCSKPGWFCMIPGTLAWGAGGL